MTSLKYVYVHWKRQLTDDKTNMEDEDGQPGFHPPDICPEGLNIDKRTSDHIYGWVEGEAQLKDVLECFSRESLCQYVSW